MKDVERLERERTHPDGKGGAAAERRAGRPQTAGQFASA